MPSLQEIVDFIRNPNRAHFVLWGCSAVLLFLPESWLGASRLLAFRDRVGDFLAPVFLVLSVLFVVVGVQWGVKKLRARSEERKVREVREARLRDLNPDERDILRPFIEDKTRGQWLSMESAVVAVLESHQVIRKATGIADSRFDARAGEAFLGTEYLIHPWAERFLKAHPELLAAAPDPEDRALRARRPR